MEHMYRGILLARPGSCSRRTTNSMPTVDRAGRKPHCNVRKIIRHCFQTIVWLFVGAFSTAVGAFDGAAAGPEFCRKFSMVTAKSNGTNNSVVVFGSYIIQMVSAFRNNNSGPPFRELLEKSKIIWFVDLPPKHVCCGRIVPNQYIFDPSLTVILVRSLFFICNSCVVRCASHVFVCC